MLPFQAQSSLEKPQNRAFATLAVYVTVISDRRSTSLQNLKKTAVWKKQLNSGETETMRTWSHKKVFISSYWL